MLESTYTLDVAAAVTASGALGDLSTVLEDQLSSGGLDDLHTVGLGVVAVAATVGQALNHFCVESLSYYHQINAEWYSQRLLPAFQLCSL